MVENIIDKIPSICNGAKVLKKAQHFIVGESKELSLLSRGGIAGSRSHVESLQKPQEQVFVRLNGRFELANELPQVQRRENAEAANDVLVLVNSSLRERPPVIGEEKLFSFD